MEVYEEAPAYPAVRRLTIFPVQATYALIALNALIFVGDYLSGRLYFQWGALMPAAVVMFNQWWRVLAAGFLHADIAHIGFNLYALYGLGSLMERFFGTRRFLAVYFTGLLGSSALVTLFSPLLIPTVGASGAIMGVLGGLVVYYWMYNQRIPQGRSVLNELARMAVINIGIGLLPGISWWGHLGGFLAGALTGWCVYPRYDDAGYAAKLPVLPLSPAAQRGGWLAVGGWLLLLLIAALTRGV